MADRDAWVLVALRLFLAITFIYAGLQKLADRWFFKASAASSLQSQLRAASHSSPIGGLISIFAQHAVPFGLLIAFGELAVGIGTLLGLWSRVAAGCGLLLSLGFLLTVSWHARPYYYGADIVFVFAWTPLLFGGAGRLSLDTLARARARAGLGLPPAMPVTIDFGVVQRLCGFYDRGRCAARHGRSCDQQRCPVLASPDSAATGDQLDRRAFLGLAGWAGWVAVTALGTGTFAAVVGRMISPSRPVVKPPVLGAADATPTTTSRSAGPPSPSSVAAPAAPSTSSAERATGPRPAAPATVPPTSAMAGSRIGLASAVAVGGAASFALPGTGHPAFVLQPTQGRFVAFDATCTHQGCPVEFTGTEFRCPCHGAVFNATSGAVIQGPARRPLSSIPVQKGPDGALYVQ